MEFLVGVVVGVVVGVSILVFVLASIDIPTIESIRHDHTECVANGGSFEFCAKKYLLGEATKEPTP